MSFWTFESIKKNILVAEKMITDLMGFLMYYICVRCYICSYMYRYFNVCYYLAYKTEFSDNFLFLKRFRGKKEEDVETEERKNQQTHVTVCCFELSIPLKLSVSLELPSTMSAVIGTVGNVDCSRVSIWASTCPGRNQKVFRLSNPTAPVICCFSEKTSCPQMYFFGILQQFWNIQN